MNDRSVLFQAVGDIAFGDHPLCAGFGTHSALRNQEPGFAFAHVASIFGSADLLFGNLECTISEAGLRPGDYHSVQMRGHRDYLEALKAVGFAVLNVANNHSLQHGRAPFVETLELLRMREILPCGVAGNSYRHAAPAVVQRNGLSIAFLGYSLRPRQYFTETPLYAEGDADSILEDVQHARSMADIVIVSLHWGDEFIDRPSPREIALARSIIERGADLIVGHHPHVLRGVERYGRGYIVYSLGNFVGDMLWEESLRESAILQCRLTANGVDACELIPVRISDRYQPTPLSGPAAAALTARLARLAERLAMDGRTIDSEGAQAAYQQEADCVHRDARRKSHRYFLRNAHRFPLPLLVQQLTTFVRNRCAEMSLFSGLRSRPLPRRRTREGGEPPVG